MTIKLEDDGTIIIFLDGDPFLPHTNYTIPRVLPEITADGMIGVPDEEATKFAPAPIKAPAIAPATPAPVTIPTPVEVPVEVPAKT